MAGVAVVFIQRQRQEGRTLKAAEVKLDFLNVPSVDTRSNNMMLITSVDDLINGAWTHRVHCNQLHFYLQLPVSPVNTKRENQTST